jgi:hypothetical protein
MTMIRGVVCNILCTVCVRDYMYMCVCVCVERFIPKKDNIKIIKQLCLLAVCNEVVPEFMRTCVY